MQIFRTSIKFLFKLQANQSIKILKISIIIPTYNGAKKIPNILQALGKQTVQDFEVIVVIDGSKDNTLEVIEHTNHQLSHLKVIQQANGGRSVARNRGVKEANGDILIFFDDDMRPTENCVARHQKHHQTFEDSILVGNVPEDLEKVQNDLQMYRAVLSRFWVKDLQYEVPLNKNNLFLTAANLSLPKNLFWLLNGFDEKLNDSEDFDLGIRALLAKVYIYFDKENIAWHDDFITLKSYIRRQRQYKISHDKLKALKPEIYAEFNQYEANQAKGIKRMIYNFFAQKFWIWSIENFNWIVILPQKIRYKIYDLVITAYAVHFPQRKI